MDELKEKKNANGVSLKLQTAICSKYFEGMSTEQMAFIAERTLDAWLAGKGILMFSNEDLKSLDAKYFSIIITDAYDVTIMSGNTGYYWYQHNPEYLGQGTVIIFSSMRRPTCTNNMVGRAPSGRR